jgi:heme/copper-type cytochrome/quinol oxidase subunit 2
MNIYKETMPWFIYFFAIIILISVFFIIIAESILLIHCRKRKTKLEKAKGITKKVIIWILLGLVLLLIAVALAFGVYRNIYTKISYHPQAIEMV